MSNFIELAKDILDTTTAFSKSMNLIYMKNNAEGEAEIAIPSSDGSMSIQALSKIEIPELSRGAVCLGSLPFLRQIMGSTFMKKDGQAELNFAQSIQRKDKNYLRTIRFHAGKRMNVTYVATDPFISTRINPTRLKVESWPVSFKIDRTMASEFRDIRSVLSASPESLKQSAFSLVYRDGEVSALFGKDQYQSELKFDTEVTADNGVRTQTALFLSDHFHRLLEMTPENGMQAEFSPNALRVSLETDVAYYEITLIRRILSSQGGS